MANSTDLRLLSKHNQRQNRTSQQKLSVSSSQGQVYTMIILGKHGEENV